MIVADKIREIVGTEVKININVEPINDLHMEDYDFECMFYALYNNRENLKKNIVITKNDMIKVDADNYIAPIDTSLTGIGEIMCRLTAWIPDGDMPEDQLRTEIVAFRTGITMY